MEKTDWTLYIIQAENGHFYTGITTDLTRRLRQHQTHHGGARFFHTSKALQVVYQEQYPDRSSASRREAEIKKLSRKQKLILIGQRADYV